MTRDSAGRILIGVLVGYVAHDANYGLFGFIACLVILVIGMCLIGSDVSND